MLLAELLPEQLTVAAAGGAAAVRSCSRLLAGQLFVKAAGGAAICRFSSREKVLAEQLTVAAAEAASGAVGGGAAAVVAAGGAAVAVRSCSRLSAGQLFVKAAGRAAAC